MKQKNIRNTGYDYKYDSILNLEDNSKLACTVTSLQNTQNKT